MSPILLLLLPWIAAALYLGAVIRVPRELPPFPTHRRDFPHLTVIVPARNEEVNIGACLASLAAQRYPSFDIVVVDDRSTDRTAEVAAGIPPANAESIRILEGEELPAGWFGKPWACRQGADVARGELLLFTDADTLHGPELLARAVRLMREERSSGVSLLGRQLMETFWERVVQPQIFTLIAIRYPRLDRRPTPRRWRSAMANGQYILVSREAYDAIGGHDAVRNEVVEDLRMAQELARSGHPLDFRGAENDFSTRMYRSLGELLEGWTKNLATGSAQSSPTLLRPLVIPAILLYLIGMWVLPPLALLAGLFRGGESLLLLWGAGATAIGLLVWTGGMLRMRVPLRYALLFPLGAALSAFIILRSRIRGRGRIVWKGRSYGTR